MSKILPIVGVCLLILAILGGVFLGRPQYQDFREKGLELEKKEIELEQKKEHYAKLAALDEKLTEYEEEFSKIDSALPREPSIPTLFYFSQKISSENGLILKNITSERISSRQAGEEEIQEFSFSISVTGSYSAFKNFLSTIYKNARMIEVNSISFSSSQEGTSLFDFSLTLFTHFSPEPKIREVFLQERGEESSLLPETK